MGEVFDENIGSGLPGAKEAVYRIFDDLGIEYEIVDHPPLYKEGDDERYRVHIDGMIFKNLFLKNKDKGRYFMYSLPLSKRADLKALQHLLGESRLSFGNENDLFEKMNIRAGSVSMLNFLGAPDSGVKLLIDSEARGLERVAVHPNDNTATVVISLASLEKALESVGVDYQYVELAAKE
jgi:Ala-tRNA(Pro) deacylase